MFSDQVKQCIETMADHWDAFLNQVILRLKKLIILIVFVFFIFSILIFYIRLLDVISATFIIFLIFVYFWSWIAEACSFILFWKSGMHCIRP